jgi:hypothetical protein
METIEEFPYVSIQFTKEGKVFLPKGSEALHMMLHDGKITDLLVLAHGWNNNMVEAQKLYRDIMRCTRAVLNTPFGKTHEERRFGVLGILWPSKKFTDLAQIPGGSAALANPLLESLKLQLEELRDWFDEEKSRSDFDKLIDDLPFFEDKTTRRSEFVKTIQSLLPSTFGQDTHDTTDTAPLKTLSPETIIERLSLLIPLTEEGTVQAVDTGQATGGFGETVLNAARNLLNLFTYYQMKERASVIGFSGVATTLREVRSAFPQVRQHLLGHSFGARLLTAATMGQSEEISIKPESLFLVQAAFSHYGFSKEYELGKSGFFRDVIERNLVSGPILITHTRADLGVGLAYPMASILSGVTASMLGDKNDRYGGLGSNGAQKTPEAEDRVLEKVGIPYNFEQGKIYNLCADGVIRGHTDIAHNEVAHAFLSAIENSMLK